MLEKPDFGKMIAAEHRQNFVVVIGGNAPKVENR
jgi:hypothetical protein